MSDLQDFRQDIMDSLQGLNAGGWDVLSGRVLDGMIPISKLSGLTLWYTCLQSGSGGSGAFVHVRAGENLDRLREGFPRFSCSVDVYFAVDKAEIDTLSGVVETVETMRRSIDGTILGGTTYSQPSFQMAGRVVVVRYVLNVSGLGCDAAIAAVRVLVNENGATVYNETGTAIYPV